MRTEEGFVDVADGRIVYQVTGTGEPLALIHAGVADSRMWSGQLDAMSARYQVITHDVRGFGKSTPAKTAHRRFEDLRAVLDQIGAARARLLGMSMGADVVMEFVLSYPERTAAIVLSGAGYENLDWSRLRTQWKAEEEAIEAGEMEQATDINMQLWIVGVGRTVGEMDPEMIKRTREMVAGTLTPENTGEALELEPPAGDRLAEIAVPALVMVGKLDQPEMIESAREIASRLPDARHTEMEGVAHLPNMEQPDQFNRLVMEFLTQT